MSEFQVAHDYPQAPALVWRALTEPELVARWTITGLGGRPDGFAPVVGNRFRYVTQPNAFFRGVVECEVLEASAPHLLKHTWIGDDDGEATLVTWRVEPHDGGSRLSYTHEGFHGVGGFFVSRILARVRRRMFAEGLPPVLDQLAKESVS